MSTREAFSTFDERAERRDRLQNRATKADIHHMKQQASKQNDVAQLAYEEGLKEGKHAARTQKPAKAKSQRTGAVKTAVTRPIKQGAAQGIRQVQAPVQEQVSSGIRTLTLVAGVVALYVFLESVPTVTGVLGGINSGLAWLKNPATSIKYQGS